MMYQSRFFADQEFVNVGCTRSDINDVSLSRLDRARGYAGIPFILTSAYRSPDHEKSKGRSGNGAHTRGRAFDISCRNNADRFTIVWSALKAGFTRIGIAKTFVHLDDDMSLPNPRIWLY